MKTVSPFSTNSLHSLSTNIKVQLLTDWTQRMRTNTSKNNIQLDPGLLKQHSIASE